MRPSLGVWTVERGVVASRAREGASGSARGEGRDEEEDERGLHKPSVVTPLEDGAFPLSKSVFR